jgi:tetratricopeptide (TPR) repeat protein
LQGLAVILEKQQKVPEAITTLQKAAAIDPSNHLTFFNLGVLQEKIHLYDACVTSYRKAVALNPKHFFVVSPGLNLPTSQ